MRDRAFAIGGLTAMPIAGGIVIGIILRHIGMSDVACVTAGAAIAVPGAIITYALLMRHWRKQDREK